MRHDAAAGGEVIRKGDKPEILAQVQAGIHTETRQAGRDCAHRHGHPALRLAPAHLGVHTIVVQPAHVQQFIQNEQPGCAADLQPHGRRAKGFLR